MKVYIAGPITEDPNYKEKFSAVAEKAKELGLEPINPAAEAPEGLTYKEYIDRGLKLLMGCDVICCITTAPGNPNKRHWPPESKGEHLEWQYAITVGMPIMKAYLCHPLTKPGEWVLEIPRCWPGMFRGEE